MKIHQISLGSLNSVLFPSSRDEMEEMNRQCEYYNLYSRQDVYLTIDELPNECTPLISSNKSVISYSSNCSSDPKSSLRNLSQQHELKQKKYCCCELPLLAIGFLLIGGTSIAAYLLILENGFSRLGFSLDLIHHEVWSSIPLQINNNQLMLNNSLMLNVIITQTDSGECYEMENCIHLLTKIQKSHENSEINYNFLIAGNGEVYEILGWKYISRFSISIEKTAMVIGFIGNYNTRIPTQQQLNSAWSLINESCRKQKLHKAFQVVGIQNLTKSHQDGEALFNQLSKWTQFHTIQKVI